MEADVRAQIDPATEQRAAGLTSLSRALSSAATGKPDANKDGDPKQAQEDLDELGEQLDQMTPAQHADLARQLAEQQATASGTTGRRRRPSMTPLRASLRAIRRARSPRWTGWARP